MEINKNELKILEFFREKLFFKVSIRELMQRINSKSYQRVYEAVEELVNKKILVSEKIGNTNLINLNFSRESILLLSFLDEKEGNKIPNYYKILDISEISDYLILVSGSYASGHFNKKSDMDLVIIIPNKKDFVEMLTDKKENYGKEIVKNKIILKNAQMFYELVKEAIENGYKG